MGSVVIVLQTAALAADAVPVVATIDEMAAHVLTISGAKTNDGFATGVTALGDVNGDGRGDLAFVGASSSEMEENVAYLLYGRTGLAGTLSLDDWSSWGVRLHAPYGQRFPMPAASLGDLDGDGYDDMVFEACAFVYDVRCPAYVLFGGPSLPREIDASSLGGLRGIEVQPDFGNLTYENGSVFESYGAGDLNGDGVRDLVVASCGANVLGTPRKSGVVYVVFGTLPWPATIDLAEVGVSIPGCRITASREGGGGSGPWLGFNVCAGKDFNGDGMDDLALAAPRWDREDGPGNEYGGAVFVVQGRSEWPTFMDLELAEDQARDVCWLLCADSGEWLGQFVFDGTDDVTGDGVPDLLVSEGTTKMHVISGSRIQPGKFAPTELAETRVEGLNPFCRGIGDWDGDGLNDLAVRRPASDSQITGGRKSGAVYLIPGMWDYPPTVYLDPYDRIVGSVEYSMFGEDVAGVDVDGDGRRDLVVTAPGGLQAQPAKLYVIPNGTELLGPLQCGEFAPQTSTLGGGGRLFVSGIGFDERTRVFVGSTETEVLVRPDSRQVVVRVPPVAAAGLFPVRVTRGEEECRFKGALRYYDSIFPREIDVAEFGERGCTVSVPLCSLENPPGECLSESAELFQGGEDITGDGLGDVLLKHTTVPAEAYWICEVHLLHGSAELPSAVTFPDDLASLGTTFATNAEGGCTGEFFAESALAVGDMDGDGVSEFAISTPEARLVYIVLGGELPKGRVLMDDLVNEGRCVLVEGCPRTVVEDRALGFWLKWIGDVNGDGLADLGINDSGYDTQGRPRGRLAFLLGQKPLPAYISYESVPKFYGKIDLIGAKLAQIHGVRDVDGDRYDDIVFSATTQPHGEAKDDAAPPEYFVLFGRSSFPPVLEYEQELANGGACRFLVYKEGWSSGIGLIGDPNRDGYADIGVRSLPNKPEYDPGRGKFMVIYGGSRDKLCRLRSIDKDSDFDIVFQQSAGYNGLIHGFTGGRDFSGDGFDDILLWDRHLDYAPPPSRAIVLFGGELERKAGPLSSLTEVLELINYKSAIGQWPGNRFPICLDFAGDVNGDGYEDLAAYDDHRVYVYYNPLGALKGAFVRGDANQDARIDIADAITVLNHLFGGAGPLPCMDAGDANDDEQVNIADAITILGSLFGGKGALRPPNQCGPDPAGEVLGCADSACR